ncbi:MAG: TolC family protein [Planctomycetota bacterium]|nr:TolC family protein [Planctomycetota bacterium]
MGTGSRWWWYAVGLLTQAGLGLPALAQDPPPAQDPKPPSLLQESVQVIPIPVDMEAEELGQPVRELSLDDALRLGRAHNMQLRAAELLPQQAQQDLLFSEAAFQPELYGSFGYAETETPTLNAFQPSIQREAIDATLGWRQRVITGGQFDLAFRPARAETTSSLEGAFPERQFTSVWSISYAQPLLRGAWMDYNLAPIMTSEQNLVRSRSDFEQTVQTTLIEIVRAYWELVYRRENYRVVAASLDVALEQLRITEERIRVQELAPRDLITDQAEVARRKEDLITAENEIRRREDDLRLLLFDDQEAQLWRWNLRPSDEIAVVPDVEGLVSAPLVEEAMTHRPELLSLRSQVAEAEIQLMKARRDLLPALDLVGDYSSDGASDTFSPAFDDSVDQQYPNWALRLQFSVPVGNQAARAEERRAELELERRNRNRYGEMMKVAKEVRDAVRNLRSLAESIVASAESVRLAESNLETEQIKFGVGSSTAFEVQERNQELREARSRHLRNQLDYRVSESQLLYVQGLLRVPED